MFSLIISIIAIALVAALAGASVYYGGAAFSKGTAGADASTFVNGGQQVQGAFTLASTDGYSPATVTALTDSTLDGDDTNDKDIYLSQVPSYKGVDLEIDAAESDYVSATVSQDVADELIDNRNAESFDGSTESPKELVAVDTSDNTAMYKVK